MHMVAVFGRRSLALFKFQIHLFENRARINNQITFTVILCIFQINVLRMCVSLPLRDLIAVLE